mgnify:CR=1 FL=1
MALTQTMPFTWGIPATFSRYGASEEAAKLPLTFYDSVSPSFFTAMRIPLGKDASTPPCPAKTGKPCGWVVPWHVGLNQGPICLMMENYRTGRVWRLMRNCPYVVSGLRRSGCTGGWL